MEGPSLTQHEIIKFLTLKGGRCTNFELVSNFRGALNHPQHQAEARLRFKDIVNTVATVGEYQNVKYIELKKEYHDNNLLSESSSSQPSSLSSDSGSSYTSPLTQNFQPYWRYRLSTSTKVPTLQVRSPDYDSLVKQQAGDASGPPPHLGRSVSESTLPEPVSEIQPPPRTRGRSASGFNRSVSSNPTEGSDSQLKKSNYFGEEYLSRRSSINGYLPQQQNFNSSGLPPQQNFPMHPESMPGDTRRHSEAFMPERPARSQWPPGSRRDVAKTTPPEVTNLSHSRSFSGAHGLPSEPSNLQALRHGPSNKLDGWKSERQYPPRNVAERSPKRTGICSDDMLRELDEESPQQYMDNPVSRSFDRMHGIASESRVGHSEGGSYCSLPDYPYAQGNKSARQSLVVSHNNVENKHPGHEFSRVRGEVVATPARRNLFPDVGEVSNSCGTDLSDDRQGPGLDYDTASVSSRESISSRLENETSGSRDEKKQVTKANDVVPVPPERRRKHSKSAADVSKENDSKRNTTQSELPNNTGKVKDRVQHFDDLEKRKSHPSKRGPSSPLPEKENRSSKTNLMEDDVSISVLDPKLKREWFVKAAQGDYYALVGLLKKEPKLAAIKDIASTALHWAAKHGNANIVKLIAGTYKVNPNIRSGGYTPIHVATLYKNILIVDLLVHTYGADASIRDYSGKRADQYPENYIRTVAGLKNVERRPLKARPLERESTVSAFMRIGSLNLRKSRKSAVFASVRGRNWGSASELRLNNYKSTRKKNSKNVQPEKKCDADTKNDSDSDSAYGFYSK